MKTSDSKYTFSLSEGSENKYVQFLAEEFAPVSIFIDEEYNIEYIHGMIKGVPQDKTETRGVNLREFCVAWQWELLCRQLHTVFEKQVLFEEVLVLAGESYVAKFSFVDLAKPLCHIQLVKRGEFSFSGNTNNQNTFSGVPLEFVFEDFIEAISAYCVVCEVINDKYGNLENLKIISANKRFGQVLGVKPVDLIHKTIFQLFPNSREAWLPNLQDVSKNGTAGVLLNYSEKRACYWEMRSCMIDQDKMLVIAYDINSKNNEIDGLNETNRFLNAVLDCSQTEIFVFETYETDLRVVNMNKRCLNTLNLTKKEVKNRSLSSFMSVYRESWISELEHKSKLCLLGQQPVEYKLCATINNRKRWWQVSLVPIHTNKSLVKRIVGSAFEITDSIKSEKELRLAKEKAEESDRLKSEFLANMSHEIRTPMNSIIGFANLLKEKTLDLGELRKYTDVICSSGSQLLHIINDIIDISKIEANQVVVINEACNLNKLLLDLTNLYRLEVSENIRIKSFFSLPERNATVLTDKTKLRQILTNLLSNAMKFTDEGYIEIGYLLRENNLVFTVQDTGIGVPEHKRNEIFERFHQLNFVKYKGTGLGLPICKALAQKIGGDINLDASYTKGARFVLTIPYNPTQPAKTSSFTSGPSVKDLSGKKILIAEDEDTNFVLLSLILKPYNAEVFRARTGRQAVEKFEEVRPDLIFMDIKMPDMDGLEATVKLREIDEDVPIIAQTAFAMYGDKKKCLLAGCSDYMSKPLKKEAVARIINQFFK